MNKAAFLFVLAVLTRSFDTYADQYEYQCISTVTLVSIYQGHTQHTSEMISSDYLHDAIYRSFTQIGMHHDCDILDNLDSEPSLEDSWKTFSHHLGEEIMQCSYHCKKIYIFGQ